MRNPKMVLTILFKFKCALQFKWPNQKQRCSAITE